MISLSEGVLDIVSFFTLSVLSVISLFNCIYAFYQLQFLNRPSIINPRSESTRDWKAYFIALYQSFRLSNLQLPSFVRNLFIFSIICANAARLISMILSFLFYPLDSPFKPNQFILNNLPALLYFTVYSLLATYLHQLYSSFHVNNVPINSESNQSLLSDYNPLSSASSTSSVKPASYYIQWSIFLCINPLLYIIFFLSCAYASLRVLSYFILFFVIMKMTLLLSLIYAGSLIYNFLSVPGDDNHIVIHRLLRLLTLSFISLLSSIIITIFIHFNPNFQQTSEEHVDYGISLLQIVCYGISDILPITGILYYISKRPKPSNVNIITQQQQNVIHISSSSTRNNLPPLPGHHGRGGSTSSRESTSISSRLLQTTTSSPMSQYQSI